MRRKPLLMIGLILIGVCFCIPSDVLVVGDGTSNVTEKAENSETNSSNNFDTSIPEKNLKIAFLTDGLFSDAGWGAFGYNAAQALQEEYAYTVDLEENVPISMIENTLIEYSKAGYDLIISHGFAWGEPSIKVGKDYPETKFVIFTGLVNSSNVASIFPMQQEGTYVLGVLAASISKTGIIGFVGGEKYPNLINIYEGYKQGAQDANSTVKVLVTYLDDWDNSTKGKMAALSQIDNGADVILHVADSAGYGVIEAAKEKGIYVLGAISDQNKLAPETVITSFVLDAKKAFDQIIKLIQNGDFIGQIFKPGLELENDSGGDGIVYIAPFHHLEQAVPDNVKLRLEQLKEDIVNGKIKIPERYSSMNDTHNANSIG